jgi:UDP-GlcNAc:undecaprenyl-phosphate/decaprenyl-phosphate GlcNAc-1-phosphate transferase
METLVLLAVAAIASWLLTPAVINMANSANLHDLPSDRRIHTQPTPRLGGVAVNLAVAAGLFVALIRVKSGQFDAVSMDVAFLVAAVGGGSLLWAAGLIDDLGDVPAKRKLAVQMLAGLFAYAVGFRIEMLVVAPFPVLDLGVLSLPMTVLWITAVTNAFNLIDGMDGLAGGVAIATLLVCGCVAAVMGNFEVVLLAAVLTGALIGFLPFNFSPARIFLGDGGSLPIGYLLSLISMQAALRPDGAVPVLFAFCVLALPILDTALAIARRWLRGTPIFGADSRHIHHQVLSCGLSHRSAALVLWSIAIVLAGTGALFALASDRVAVLWLGGLLMLSVILGLAAVRNLKYHELAVLMQALRFGPQRARATLRDHIYAEDIVRAVEGAKTLPHLNSLLLDGSHKVGFKLLTVDHAARLMNDDTLSYGYEPTLTLRYPVSPEGSDRPLFVTACLNPERDGNGNAERLMARLVPALRSWAATWEASQPPRASAKLRRPVRLGATSKTP